MKQKQLDELTDKFDYLSGEIKSLRGNLKDIQDLADEFYSALESIEVEEEN